VLIPAVSFFKHVQTNRTRPRKCQIVVQGHYRQDPEPRNGFGELLPLVNVLVLHPVEEAGILGGMAGLVNLRSVPETLSYVAR
jgi:hypothetical protein